MHGVLIVCNYFETTATFVLTDKILILSTGGADFIGPHSFLILVDGRLTLQ